MSMKSKPDRMRRARMLHAGRLALTLALAAGFVSITPASAIAAKKKKKKKKKKGRAVTPDKKAKVQAVTASGPTLKYEQFRRGIEVKLAAKREEQIAKLKRLLELGLNDEEVPDVKFRLAELYFEKSQFFFFRSQEADDKASRAKNPGARDAARQEQKKHLKDQQYWANEAVEVYKELRERYPRYERMPEVLFALGQSYWNAEKFDDAIDVYRDLIKNFKKSPLVVDAWLAFGEYYFNNKDLQSALKAYELAAGDKKKEKVYAFAVYKQGWCYYNLAEWNKALSKFRTVVYYADVVADQANKIALAREARKDFVKTYAHSGSPRKAKFVIADISGDESGECRNDLCFGLLEQLARLWFDQGNFNEAGIVYRDLIRIRPRNTRNPYFQSRIVDLVSREDNKRGVITESRRLVDLYQRLAEHVEKNPKAGQKAKDDLEEAKVLAESTIRRLAQVWNREAKKTRQSKTYEFAKTMYEDYLKLFPKNKDAYEMRFQLGDLYYKLEMFDKAADMYEATVLANPKGKYLIDAANDNILALEEHIKDKRPPKPKPKDEKAVEIHPLRVKLIKACDRYIEKVPAEKAEKLVAIKFKAGKIYYDHNQFEEAIKRFQDIVEKHPKSEEAEYAANLVVDVYNLKESWQLLYDTSVAYLRVPELIEEREKLEGDLRRFAEYSKFKLIQILEENLKKEGRELRQVAMAYEEFQAEFPKSENADKALFNAAVAWESVGERARANQLRTKLLNEYKDSSLRPDVAYHIARSFEERAEYDAAAPLFENFAEDYPTDERARDALYNAAVFFAGVGEVKKATKLREEYLKKYGKTKKGGKGEKEAADIYWNIAQDLERNKNWSLAARRYAEFADKFSGDDRFFEALWREKNIRMDHLGHRSKANELEKKIYGTYHFRKKRGKPMPTIAADYASRIALANLEDEYKKYEKLKVSRPNLKRPKKFKQDIAKKAQGRERVIKLYTGIVTTYQQAYSTIGALYRIAISWDEFVNSLTSIQCPKGLPPEACDIFKQQLETEIEPARQSAFQAYETCVAKSNELNTFTPDSTACVKVLEKQGRYPEVVEKRARPKGGEESASLQIDPRGPILRSPTQAAPQKNKVAQKDDEKKGGKR